MMQLEDWLLQGAQTHPAKTAIICGGDSISYHELWNEVEAYANKYRQDGGSRIVVLRSSQTIRFLTEYFACHLAGKVCVPLESNCPDSRFDAICQELRACLVPENVADILYTTGTTGYQKGIMISHRYITANAENLVSGHHYSSELLFVISGPLNHLGSISKVWATVMVGATLCLTDGIKDMNAFLSTFHLPYAKVASFLVPSSIRVLLQFAHKELSALSHKIDFIETGAAPMSQSDMESLCRLLPHSRLYNTYASTETGIVCTHDYNDGYCISSCVGKPMKHASVFITGSGNIACRGETLMEGYAGDMALTTSVLHDGAVFTQDNGSIDEQGRLHLTVRSGDIINTGGFKVNPVQVEEAVLAYPGIEDCICTEGNHPVLGIVLKLYIVLEDGFVLDKKDLARFLQEKLEKHAVPHLYSITDHIERTYNGKLNRNYYRNLLRE